MALRYAARSRTVTRLEAIGARLHERNVTGSQRVRVGPLLNDGRLLVGVSSVADTLVCDAQRDEARWLGREFDPLPVRLADGRLLALSEPPLLSDTTQTRWARTASPGAHSSFLLVPLADGGALLVGGLVATERPTAQVPVALLLTLLAVTALILVIVEMRRRAATRRTRLAFAAGALMGLALFAAAVWYLEQLHVAQG